MSNEKVQEQKCREEPERARRELVEHEERIAARYVNEAWWPEMSPPGAGGMGCYSSTVLRKALIVPVA